MLHSPQRISELEERVTILKAERDEFERQRNEVQDAMTVALDGWYRCATCEIASGDEIEAETVQIDEMRRKYAKA